MGAEEETSEDDSDVDIEYDERATISTRTRRRRKSPRRKTMTSTSTTSKFKTLRRGGATTECGGHDESLFRTGFFKISVLASKRHLTWAVARALFIITQQEATCSICVNCVNLLLSAPENSMSPQARSP